MTSTLQNREGITHPLKPIEITVAKKGSKVKPGFQRAYIGRGTPLGNPFSHLERSTAEVHVGSRDEAVDAYGEWLDVLLGRRAASSAPVVRWFAQRSAEDVEARRRAVRRQLNDLFVLALAGAL